MNIPFRTFRPTAGFLVKVEMGGVCGTDVKYLHGKLKVDYPRP